MMDLLLNRNVLNGNVCFPIHQSKILFLCLEAMLFDTNNTCNMSNILGEEEAQEVTHDPLQLYSFVHHIHVLKNHKSIKSKIVL